MDVQAYHTSLQAQISDLLARLENANVADEMHILTEARRLTAEINLLFARSKTLRDAACNSD